MLSRKRVVSLLFCLASVVLICACATVAGTNRKQLNIYSDDEVNQASALSYREEVLDSGKLSTNQTQVNMVRKVGERIAAAATIYMRENRQEDQIKNYQWEFNLIDDPNTVNAFCMPGGKVAFYTGILPICQNETGIAVVMGHEVAHALARHGNERISQQALAQYAQTAAAAGLGIAGISGTTAELASLAFGAGTNVAVILPFSRKHESEADEIGLYLMAMAGYDPNAAVDFWQRMADASGGGGMAFLSTHPSDKQRIADLKKLLPKAEAVYQQNRGK